MTERTVTDSSASQQRRGNFLRAVAASVLGTGLSRVLGALRDVVIARIFGANGASDAFWIAFTVPNTLRRFVADEGLTGALIPAVARAETEQSHLAARQLANRLLTALLLINLMVCVAGWFGAEWLVKAFAYSFVTDPEKFALTVTLTRWLMPFIAMVSLVSFCEALLNHRGHFFVPKVAPGLVSAGIVVAALIAVDRFEHPTHALAAGVLFGGLTHVLVNLPVLWRRWGALRFDVRFVEPRVRHVLRELGKVLFIGVFAQINILVLRQLAAMVGEGGITHYWYANRLVDLSQGVIAVAIGSALLPNVSEAVAGQHWDRLRDDIAGALRLTAFLLFPVALSLLTFAEPLTALLFRHGAWTWQDTTTTAYTLQLLVPFMLAIATINVLKKVFFAFDDRNSLLMVGGVGIAITAALGWWLVGDHGVPGLAVALSVSTCTQLLIYGVLLHRRLGDRFSLASLSAPLVKMLLAGLCPALVMGGVASVGQWQLGPASLLNWLVCCGGGMVGALLWLLASKTLALPEYDDTVGRVLRRFGR